MQTIEELKEEYSSYIELGYSDISVGFYKERKRDKIYDVFVGAKDPDGKMIAITEIGSYLFSFDKKIIYNFFSDYDELSPEQKEIFRKENPTMANLKE